MITLNSACHILEKSGDCGDYIIPQNTRFGVPVNMVSEPDDVSKMDETLGEFQPSENTVHTINTVSL